jgi:deoxycytidylate deaminase
MPINNIENPELFVAFVSPIGVNLKFVIEKTAKVFSELGYQPYPIKLSKVIAEIPRYKICQEKVSEKVRIRRHMDAGDHLRKITGRSDAVVMAGISAIQSKRKEVSGDIEKPVSRAVYIIDSLKHPSEIKLLKSIYGKLFFCISVIDDRENRVSALSDRMAESEHESNVAQFRSAAEELIELDYNSDGKKFSQNVKDAFSMSDAFLGIGEKETLQDKIQRIAEAWFGHPFRTPTKDEYGMYLAKSAALRSADLSRQVGAAIVSINGEVLALGCNEVPHAGGRLIWEGDEPDHRDFKVGYDSTVKMKHKIISEIVKKLYDGDWLSEKFKEIPIDQLATDLISGSSQEILKGTRVTNIIEFGRVVHAEMTAITECSRRGIAAKNAVLYCTTFPCHMCARHIISTGIQSVYYIEPYPKSMAKELYKNIVHVDSQNIPDSVHFRAFEGIGPNKFMEIFDIGDKERKDKFTGDAIKWDGKSAYPSVEGYYRHYLHAEMAVQSHLSEEKHGKLFGLLYNDEHPFPGE